MVKVLNFDLCVCGGGGKGLFLCLCFLRGGWGVLSITVPLYPLDRASNCQG